MSEAFKSSGDPIVIVSFARTPMGGFQGALAGAKATELGATAVKAAIERAGVSGDQVEQIFMTAAGLVEALNAALATQTEIPSKNLGRRDCAPEHAR